MLAHILGGDLQQPVVLHLGVVSAVVLGPDVDAPVGQAHLQTRGRRGQLADAEGLEDKRALELGTDVDDRILGQALHDLSISCSGN